MIPYFVLQYHTGHAQPSCATLCINTQGTSFVLTDENLGVSLIASVTLLAAIT